VQVQNYIAFFLIGLIIGLLKFFFYLVENWGKVNMWKFNSDTQKEKNRIPKFPNEKIIIGKKGSKELCLPVNIAHAYVCGTTGSGKTVALSNFIDCAIKNEFPLLLLDGKGDLGKGSMLDIVKQINQNQKLYIIDMNNPETSTKYNPFQNTNATIIKDMLINLSEWTEEHYKANTERYIQRVIEFMNLAGIKTTFHSIVYYLDKDNFLELSNKMVKEKRIEKTEHIKTINIVETSAKIVQGAVARFAMLGESVLGSIFSEDGIDIFTALKEKAIILFILNPLLYPVLSQSLGRLIIIDSKKSVSHMYTQKLGRTFFIFDEINVYASKVFLDLVNKSRSADITCVLASQSLSDLNALEDEDFKEQILENCNNYIIMRQNSPKNAEEWANVIGTENTLAVTYQLDNNGGITTDTGRGTATRTKEYIFHPDEIKNLKTGNAFLVSKDYGFRRKIVIRKPF
jgi:type IV secretory pathway TraG/TraD family ATPase VirD4